MTKTKNGILLVVKIVGIVLVIVLAVIAWIWQAAGIAGDVETNTEDIVEIKPEVRKNTEYRIQAEVDTRYIKEKVTNIETVQQQILEEVRK